jgi:hypothetical protein
MGQFLRIFYGGLSFFDIKKSWPSQNISWNGPSRNSSAKKINFLHFQNQCTFTVIMNWRRIHWKSIIWNRHGYRQSHWVSLTVTVCIFFSSWVRVCLSTLQRWQPKRQFHYRWVVKTGFCKRDFGQTNEHQLHLNNQWVAWGGRVHSNHKRILFLSPSRKGFSSLTLGSELSCLPSVNMMYRVLLSQGGEIYCNTLLIPGMGKETFW